MNKRLKPSQTKHDKTVRKVAGGYKSQGWNVHADVKGYPKPKTIFGNRPDVIAQKGKKLRIVEVETPSSYKSDRLQRGSFKRFASLNNKRKFRIKLTKRS